MGAWIEIVCQMFFAPIKFVAPFMGAWIEIIGFGTYEDGAKSHPLWVRGLKLVEDDDSCEKHRSHPLWVRGLKLLQIMWSWRNDIVAPFMGAWIEIPAVHDY